MILYWYSIGLAFDFIFHKLASPQLYACFRYPRTLYLLHLVAMHHDGRAFVRLLWQEPDLSAQIDSICGPLNVGPTCGVISFHSVSIVCTEIFPETTSPHLSAPPGTLSVHHSLASASSNTCECQYVLTWHQAKLLTAWMLAETWAKIHYFKSCHLWCSAQTLIFTICMKVIIHVWRVASFIMSSICSSVCGSSEGIVVHDNSFAGSSILS